jgi:hypothetical protein
VPTYSLNYARSGSDRVHRFEFAIGSSISPLHADTILPNSALIFMAFRGPPGPAATRVENLCRSCRAARWSRKKFDAVVQTSQLADHLARSYVLRFCADGWPAFLIANAW